MKFITKNPSHSTLHSIYKETYIEATVSKSFFCLFLISICRVVLLLLLATSTLVKHSICKNQILLN